MTKREIQVYIIGIQKAIENVEYKENRNEERYQRLIAKRDYLYKMLDEICKNENQK